MEPQYPESKVSKKWTEQKKVEVGENSNILRVMTLRKSSLAWWYEKESKHM